MAMGLGRLTYFLSSFVSYFPRRQVLHQSRENYDRATRPPSHDDPFAHQVKEKLYKALHNPQAKGSGPQGSEAASSAMGRPPPRGPHAHAETSAVSAAADAEAGAGVPPEEPIARPGPGPRSEQEPPGQGQGHGREPESGAGSPVGRAAEDAGQGIVKP